MAPDLHVILFPWSAFGHMIPFYHLSISLAKQGVHVSYLTTPRNIERLPKVPPGLAPLMQYVGLELPVVPDLPSAAEATVDLDFEKVQYLKVAYDLLRDPFKQFVTSHPPNWIISDFAAHWMPELAQECQVQLMYFSIIIAASLSFLGPPEYLTGEAWKRVRGTPESLTAQPVWGGMPSVVYHGFEAAGFHPGFYGNNASGLSDAERLAKMIQGCQAVGIRSCREFEGEYIDLYQTITQKPVVPAGLLPPPKPEETGNTSHGPWMEAFKWLDQQSHRSVIYVAFGSETKLTKQEVHEIAYGLQLAQLPYLWALRRPTWAADDSEALPPEFDSQESKKGIVSFGWAPQDKILAHPSVGGSLFHSGCASMVETLQYGHILILLPFVFDQGLNARALVEKGLGIEVQRRKDGSFTRDDIADALRRGMYGDEAQKIRHQARQAAAIFGDRALHQEHYIAGFVKHLRNNTKHK